MEANLILEVIIPAIIVKEDTLPELIGKILTMVGASLQDIIKRAHTKHIHMGVQIHTIILQRVLHTEDIMEVIIIEAKPILLQAILISPTIILKEAIAGVFGADLRAKRILRQAVDTPPIITLKDQRALISLLVAILLQEHIKAIHTHQKDIHRDLSALSQDQKLTLLHQDPLQVFPHHIQHHHLPLTLVLRKRINRIPVLRMV